MIHARAPHFLWPYAVRYAAHQLNLQPRVSQPEASPTSLWTGSPSVGSAFRVWGCLALVRDTSADKLLARAVPYIFLGFPFDEFVSYYARYPCRGLPVPPSPLFLAPAPLPAPAPPVPLPPPGPAPSGVSHATPLPLVARQVAPSSPQSSSQSPQQPLALPRQVAVDSGGVGAGGAAPGGARSRGARSRGAGTGGTGTGGVRLGGAGAGGSGAGGADTGGAHSGGAGVGGPGIEGARTGGAGARDLDPGGTPSGDTGTGGASFEKTGSGGTTSVESTPPPHHHDMRYQAACRRAREEQERLERERQALRHSHRSSNRHHQHQQPPPPPQPQQQQPPQQQLQQPPPPPQPQQLPLEWQLFLPVSGLWALGLPSSPPVRSQSPPAFGPTFPPPDDCPLVWSSPPPQSPPVVRHYHSRPCPPTARPTSRVTDLHNALLCTSLRRSPVSSSVFSSFVTNPRFSPSSVSALTAAVADFATASPLDYSTRVVPTPPTHPLSVGGEFALGCDILEDRQSEVAVDSELVSWRSTGTYVDAVPPPRANVVDGMWLFKVKRPPGSPPVFKARYVARGFSQREGVDFFQTFAPTPKMNTLRWSLRRPVYGLRQSPREWHDTLRSTLCDLGFRPSSADPSLFVRTGSTPFFILVYVDDLVFATPDRAALAEVKSKLQKRHRCTDLGELQRYLGLQITRDKAAHTITLTQSHMVQQVLQRFGFQVSATQPTPLAVDHRLTGPFPNEPFEPSAPYPELVGCLMYLMTFTCPDLAYPLSVLSCFVGPGRHRLVHWTAVVRVATYLVTTSGMGLLLGGNRPVELTGHCDSSYADDVETQRSTQGYCFSLRAGAVSWRSTRSSSVASSSAKAEIYAGAMASQELR
ncbi:unnamed protein product [Closterium sp. NIES-53]